jgi:hypothetical protein
VRVGVCALKKMKRHCRKLRRTNFTSFETASSPPVARLLQGRSKHTITVKTNSDVYYLRSIILDCSYFLVVVDNALPVRFRTEIGLPGMGTWLDVILISTAWIRCWIDRWYLRDSLFASNGSLAATAAFLNVSFSSALTLFLMNAIVRDRNSWSRRK